MKNIIAILIFFISANIMAQDPMLQRDAPKLEKIAYDITRTYNQELALDGQQIILFQKKVEEFLIRRENIEKELSGKKKLYALVQMQARETAEMNDILTRIQLDLYKKIKPQIQPLAVDESMEKKEDKEN